MARNFHFRSRTSQTMRVSSTPRDRKASCFTKDVVIARISCSVLAFPWPFFVSQILSEIERFTQAPMSVSSFSFVSFKRERLCTVFKVFLIIFQVLLLLHIFERAFENGSTAGLSSYPTFSESRKHFLNSVGSFTSLRHMDPNVASKSYLSTSKISTRDKNFLRYFIDEYISFHKENRHNATKRLIFSPLRTGIGDRMGCLMFAYWAAVLSKRVFLVDWNYPFPLREFLTEANGLNIFLEEGQIDNETKVGKLAVLSYNQSSLATYEEVLSSDTNTVVMATNKQPGPFSASGLAKLIPDEMTPHYVNTMRLDRSFHRAILHHVFKLSDRIRRDQETLNQMKGLSSESAEERRRPKTGMQWLLKPFLRPRRPYIAVHARIGGVGESKTHRFKNISANTKTAARCLASRAVGLASLGGNPVLPVYLATDTPHFREIFENAVHWHSNGRIDVVSGSWGVQHSNKLPANYNKALREADWEMMWGGYMDLVMLGHGEHILALYSSFPRLAAALGNAESITELRNHICFSM